MPRKPIIDVNNLTDAELRNLQILYTDSRIEERRPRYTKEILDVLFGEKEINELRIRTWSDIENDDALLGVIEKEDSDCRQLCISKEYDSVFRKCLYAAKLAILIDYGYQGAPNGPGYRIAPEYEGSVIKIKVRYDMTGKEFPLFRTQELAEKFMSYDENMNMLRNYYGL